MRVSFSTCPCMFHFTHYSVPISLEGLRGQKNVFAFIWYACKIGSSMIIKSQMQSVKFLFRASWSGAAISTAGSEINLWTEASSLMESKVWDLNLMPEAMPRTVNCESPADLTRREDNIVLFPVIEGQGIYETMDSPLLPLRWPSLKFHL